MHIGGQRGKCNQSNVHNRVADYGKHFCYLKMDGAEAQKGERMEPWVQEVLLPIVLPAIAALYSGLAGI